MDIVQNSVMSADHQSALICRGWCSARVSTTSSSLNPTRLMPSAQLSSDLTNSNQILQSSLHIRMWIASTILDMCVSLDMPFTRLDRATVLSTCHSTSRACISRLNCHSTKRTTAASHTAIGLPPLSRMLCTHSPKGSSDAYLKFLYSWPAHELCTHRPR